MSPLNPCEQVGSDCGIVVVREAIVHNPIRKSVCTRLFRRFDKPLQRLLFQQMSALRLSDNRRSTTPANLDLLKSPAPTEDRC